LAADKKMLFPTRKTAGAGITLAAEVSANVGKNASLPEESVMSSDHLQRYWKVVFRMLSLAIVIAAGHQLPAADDTGDARTVARTIGPGQPLPTSEWVDALRAVDVQWDTVSGDWRRSGTDLATGPIPYSRVMLPVRLEGSYDLKVDLTRLHRDDRSATIVFPVGPRTCLLHLGAWAIHGLERIDGMITGDRLNPATRRPGLLINGQRYSVTISVRLEGNQAEIDVTLDDQPLVSWTGRQESLDVLNHWALPARFRPALAGHETVVIYHAAEVRAVSGTARMTEPQKPPAVDFAQDNWSDLLGEVDLERDTIRGRWRKVENGLAVAPVAQDERFVRLMLPREIHGSYDLVTEFTRNLGTDSVTVTFPVISRLCTLHFSATSGQMGGLEQIDGKSIVAFHNPTLRRPSGLINGRRYQALIQVRTQGDHASICVWLDGKPFTSWTGLQASLGDDPGWALPERNRAGLGANEGNVTFHRVMLRPAADTLTPAIRPRSRQGE
jgi:hypothetical protein